MSTVPRWYAGIVDRLGLRLIRKIPWKALGRLCETTLVVTSESVAAGHGGLEIQFGTV